MHPALTRTHAFAQAISAQDPSAAKALCSAAGWGPSRDTPRGLFEQALRKRLSLGAGVLLAERGARAAIAVPLLRGQKVVASLHLLDAGQGLAGVTRLASLAHYFVEGAVEAPSVFEQLPSSPKAKAFVQSQIQDLEGAVQRADSRESLPGLTQLRDRVREGEPLELGSSYELANAGRYAVALEVGGDPRWWILQRTEEGLQTRMVSELPGFERLLDPRPLTPRTPTPQA